MVTILKKSTGKKELEKIQNFIGGKNLLDTSKYCGKIKLKEEPIIIQKKLRNEWQ